MKKFKLFLIAALTSGSVVYSSPLLSLGEHADLYAQVSGSVAYTDNLTLDETDELDDVRFTVTPGFVFEVGRGLTNLNGSLSVNYGIVRYVDNTTFDTGLWNVVGELNFSGPRYDAGVMGGYVEKQQNQNDVNADQILILQKNAFAGGNIKYRISEKISVGARGRYDNITYDGGGNLDQDKYAVPVDVYYELTPKLDATAGFRYRQTDVIGGGVDYDDYFYNVGLTGSLTEKFSTTFKVGYQTRDLTGGGASEGTVTLNSVSTYDPTDRGSLRFSINRDFATGGEGSSIEQTGGSVTYFHLINPRLSANLTGGYTYGDYLTTPRADDTWLARIGANYRFNSLWSLDAYYSYRDNDSSAAGASYTENLVSVGANFRY